MIILEMLPFKWACECLHHLHYKSYALCMHARKQELAGSLLSTAAELAQRQSLPSRQRFNMCHAIILTQLRQGRRAACTAFLLHAHRSHTAKAGYRVKLYSMISAWEA